MKKTCLVLFLIFLVNAVIFGSDFESVIVENLQNGEYGSALENIQNWEKEDPENINIDIYYFNYYAVVNSKSYMEMGQMPDGRYGLYSKTDYVEEDVRKANTYLDKVLAKKPEMIYVWGGKITSYLNAGMYDDATAAILSFLAQSKECNNQWVWKDCIPISELTEYSGEQFLFKFLEDYTMILADDFNATKDDLKIIVDKCIEAYPENAWAYDLAFIYYRQSGDYESCVKNMEKCVALDSSDFIFIGNLAYSYELAGDYENALRYYNELLKTGIQEEIDYANDGIDSVNEKMKEEKATDN